MFASGLQDMQEAPAAGITADEEVWENERFVFLKGWSSPGLMPQDLAARKKRFKHGSEGYDSFPSLRCPPGDRTSASQLLLMANMRIAILPACTAIMQQHSDGLRFGTHHLCLLEVSRPSV